MASLEELKIQRKTIKSAITRQQNAVRNFKETDNILCLETRLADLTDLFKKYDSIQTEFEALQFQNIAIDATQDEAALDTENDRERSKVESQYYDTIADINTILIKHKSSNENSNNSGQSSSTVINISRPSDYSDKITNLKPLPLPSFNGKHSDWFNFYDSFKSLVDDDATISDIRKFHYLRSCLKEEALRAIESLSISGANYESAISLLKKRFENKRLIVEEHINNILNMPVVHKTSHIELRQILDTVNNNLAALKVLKIPVDQWDLLLIANITGKLDFATRKEWKTTLEKDLPTFKRFLEFIEKRCEILESVASMQPTHGESSSHQKYQSNSKVANFNKQTFSNPRRVGNKFLSNVISTNKLSCYVCKKGHYVYQCPEFLSKGVTERLKQVKDLNLCANCLKINHEVNNCRSNVVCKNCGERHHTLLHINEFAISSPTTCHVSALNQVLLSTALVFVEDSVGNLHECRALLDQGSQANIITASMCKKLNIKPSSYNSTITGINSRSIAVNECVKLNFKSRTNSYTSNINCLVVPKITEPTPANSFLKNNIIIPPNINLADPQFNISEEINLLLGAELFWNILISGPIQFEKSQPYFQDTKLGWLIGGKIMFSQIPSKVICHLTIENLLKDQVENFWKHEEVEVGNTWSLEQLACETHFLENTVRNSQGQFVVRLPFKEQRLLGNSYSVALKRFLNLERAFIRNAQLETDYKGFMTEYLNLQHMEPVPLAELENPKSYYLPHHAVFKRTIGGPKIRVVFDASAPSSNGISLNDNLQTGPTIQEDLFSILCRFRIHNYVLSADITKMYRMVWVHPDDQEFQRILWRFDNSQPVQAFKLKTVTYGTTCAPFLAVRCLHQLATEANQDFPLASSIIRRDFYMDDLLTGSNTISEVLEIKNQISVILAAAGFNLCKWISNSPDIIKANSTDADSINLNKSEDCKILGFFWNHKSDLLKFNVIIEPSSVKNPITKRKILSAISKLFDPLGLVNPVVVNSKILLQKIWTLKLDWDQPVPEYIKNWWLKYIHELQELNNCRIPRHVISSHSSLSLELHGFADASTKAYGACLYIKTIDSSGNTSVHLLCAKSRVAPIKTITLPRLELNAALLLTKLVIKAAQSLNLTFNSRFFWTDSTIVLAWLKESSQNWKQYVGNRVAIIQQCSSFEEWRHVRSSDNPADSLSRGAMPQQLNNMPWWWHGPSWLLLDANHWPKLDNDIRQKFWPISGRNLVRKIIFSCYKCRRANPRINKQKMGDLPKQRLEPLRPFFVAGVDYAGPFLIKEGHTRNMKKVKAYIALFICFTTKAVHLELVGSLSTESFLAALKRFTARRGLVSELYCDNGTNFVGAERELLRASHFHSKITDFLSSRSIKFHFIPARSPHFGGLWERNIRSVKVHLQRVVGDASLTYEEFYTLLTCIEACLNSRPLISLTQDPDDLDVLTPGHFLIGSPLTSTAEEDVTPLNINRLSRWQRVQQLTQHFWRRWQSEYLSELQTRPKGQQAPQSNIKVGDLVVVMEENLPPLKWRMGRVTKLHPGSDKLVRVVEIKTAYGTVKRAIKKIGVLCEE